MILQKLLGLLPAPTITGGVSLGMPLTDAAMASGTFPSLRSGGIVGAAGAMRQADPAWWAGSRHYSKGGPVLEADAVPIIAHKGERVLTAEQNRAYEAGSGPAINITQNIQVGSSVSRGEVMAAMHASKEAAKAELLDSMRRSGRYS